MSSQQIGNAFEMEVAELYNIMGYEVELNTLIAGQQVDIIATKYIPGGGLIKLMIECKYKGESKTAGNEDIQSIAGAYALAKASNLIHSCIVVTTNSFTLQAKEAAKASGILLKTKGQLIEELIDFSQYFKELRRAYIAEFGDKDNSWFIKSKAKYKNETLNNLDEFFENWLLKENKKPFVIRGGYGTGKSSFCKHFALNLIGKDPGVFPIIIELRDFQKAIKIESLIRDFLDRKCLADSPRFEIFWKMYKEKKILIFFDGFDEMASRVDSTVIESNLIEIERFSKEVGNVIITCRPEYFISEKEELKAWIPKNDPLVERMAEYEPIDLELWNNEQVEYYIRQRLKNKSATISANKFLSALEEVSADSDIATRAVHLDIAVKVLPFMIENGIELNRPNLYKTYISSEFDREVIKNKRLRIISDDDRLALLTTIAFKNYSTLSDELDFETTANVIKTELKIPKQEIDSVTRDFLNRSFLTRDNNSYRFAHKSLGEYLVATRIYDFITNNDFSFIHNCPLSSAISGMTFELFGGFGKFLKYLDKFNLNEDLQSTTYFKKVVFLSLSLSDLLHAKFMASKVEKNDGYYALAGLAHDIGNLIGAIRLLSDSKVLFKNEVVNEDNGNSIRSCWFQLLELMFRLEYLSLYDLKLIPIATQVNVVEILKKVSVRYSQRQVIINGSCKLFSGDKVILARIFHNLIVNAFYEINIGLVKNSKLEIDIIEDEHIDKQKIYITLTNSTVEYKLSKNFLFDMFKFEFTTKRKGYGIGLHIIKYLVELHNGSIAVEQINGKIKYSLEIGRL